MTLVHNADLFSKKFDLTVCIGRLSIGMIQLWLKRQKLILQRRDNDNESFFAKVM